MRYNLETYLDAIVKIFQIDFSLGNIADYGQTRLRTVQVSQHVLNTNKTTKYRSEGG